MKPTLPIAFLCLAAWCGPVFAQAGQTSPTPPKPAETPKPAPKLIPAKPEDVASMDAILAALYDVISGPAGKKRDWDRFRSLFAPGARLIPTAKSPDGSLIPRVVEPEGYIERSSPFFDKNGFYEREISRKVEQFGPIAHVFSTYESRHAPEEKPFSRGINSIQLFNDGKRWWVVTVFWDSERDGQPLPEKYLKSEK